MQWPGCGPATSGPVLIKRLGLTACNDSGAVRVRGPCLRRARAVVCRAFAAGSSALDVCRVARRRT